MKHQHFAPLVGVLLALVVWSCGGDAPTSPTQANSPAPTELPASTSQTFIIRSGETNAPVVGEKVKVGGGQEGLTDASGSITFHDLAANAMVDIMAAGFLQPRATQRDYNPGDVYLLWPDRPGFDANFTKTLVYWGRDDTVIHRWMKNQIPEYVSPELQDADILQAAQQGAALASAANGQQTISVTTTQPPSGSGFISVSLNTSMDPGTGAEGFYDFNQVNGVWQTTGGRIEFRTKDLAKDAQRWAHEIGHLLGLGGHNPGPGIMNVTGQRTADFSLEEKLLFKMILLREHTNRWPDRDRSQSQSLSFFGGESRQLTVVCPF